MRRGRATGLYSVGGGQSAVAWVDCAVATDAASALGWFQFPVAVVSRVKGSGEVAVPREPGFVECLLLAVVVEPGL